MAKSIFEMLKYAFIPFNVRPEEPAALPAPTSDPTEEQVAQCQAIFDEAEARRSRIEQKAQWAFAVIAFLVPFLASLLVFIFRDPMSAPRSHIASLSFLSLSAGLLLLSFFSAARALAIRSAETLHLEAVVDAASGQFRTYAAGFHAQGLLYCAVINTAMNDHMAQLVKGAHVFAASGLVLFLCGTMPASLSLLSHKQSPSEATIVGPVSLTSSDLATLSAEVAHLAQMLASRELKEASTEQLTSLEGRTTSLEAEIATLETVKSVPKPALRPKRRAIRRKHS